MNHDSLPSTAAARGPFPGAFLAAHDWAASPLGAPADWPHALRAAVTLMQDSLVPMWLAWGESLTMVYNEAYAAMLGGKHPTALGAPLAQVWAEIWPEVGTLVDTALAGHAIHREDLPLLVDRDGVRRQAWFTFSYTPLRDDHDVVRGLNCIVWETTDKMQGRRDLAASEAALRDREALFQTMFETIDEGFCIIEFLDGPHGPMSDYVHVMANPAYLTNAGIADVVGQKVREMVPAEADAWVETYRNVLVTGKPIRFQRELERTGRYLELAAFRVEPVERRQVAVLFQDVTARHRAELGLRTLAETLEVRVADEVAQRLRTEDALRQAQKMEAVGQLTGGIAHDFNNMLAVVLNSLELLARKFVADDPRAMRYVDAARNGARRAAQLTQRLLAFSRQQPLKPQTIDANKLVAGMSDLLRHSLGGHLEIETVQGGGLWRTHADPGQLENAILNLAVNARDAMPQGGRLTIETANAHLDERYAADHVGLAAGQYVQVSVSDTGTGMPAEVVAKAFDPFFTTKEVGQGTGLGLSQVYGFVKQSGGHVRIYSEPGQGTTVKLYLPRLQGAVADTPEQGGSDTLPRGENRELILVVEDEPDVRQLAADALTELGYGVLTADGGESALALLDAHPDVTLLFTDVVMPGMNGRKLVDEALRRRPALKVLFTTGYTRNAIVHNGMLDAGVHLIGKPYSLDELAAKARAVLDETA